MIQNVAIVGAGLAGSEAALVLAQEGLQVSLYEMRPHKQTPVHKTGNFAELVCSNSLKGTRADSAAGMLKQELDYLSSPLFRIAQQCRVPAGGALAVNRDEFSHKVTDCISAHENITVMGEEVTNIDSLAHSYDAVIIATGPLTSDKLSDSLLKQLGTEELSFYDAAAPIVMADSLDRSVVFSQSRYDDETDGDYLNAPLSKEEYLSFIDALLQADKVIAKDFETKELFQACQPIEEIARSGIDAPRYGALKPVGLIDPRSGKRPYAVVQLRKEDLSSTSYNLVGFQTNLTFPAQKEVFRMIPGLEQAEFARYGVMHRNTFLQAPQLLHRSGLLKNNPFGSTPVYVAGQLAGTEGYCEAIRSGMNCALSVLALSRGGEPVSLSPVTVFGALMNHATNPETKHYQPMHVNFGIMPPLAAPIRNKRERYQAFAERGESALRDYVQALKDKSIWSVS